MPPDEVIAAPAASPTIAPAADAAAPAAASPAPASSPAEASPSPSTASAPSTPEVASSPSPSTATPEKGTEAKPEPTLLEAAEAKNDKTKPEATPEKKEEPKADAKAEKTETKPDDKKSDAKSEPAPAKTDPAKEATTAEKPPVKYEAFKVPDGVKLDDERIKPFVDVLGSHQVPQEQAQKLVDLHIAEMSKYHEQTRKEQRDVWSKLNNTWKADTRKELGNHHDTDLALAKAVIEEFGGSAEQQREYLAHLNNNGMGNFIGHIRLLRNIGRALNVFEDSVVPAQGSAPKPQKSPGNRGWYDDNPRPSA